MARTTVQRSLVAILASLPLVANPRVAAEEPREKSAWAGFMAGSWVENEWIGVPPDPKGPSRTLSLLEGQDRDGDIHIQR